MSGALKIRTSTGPDVWQVIGSGAQNVPFFNVKDYGAVGDGVAADGSKIQDACNDCNSAGGGIVYMPSGTYKMNVVPIEMPLNSTLQGSGQDATVINYTGSGAAIRLWNPGVQEIKGWINFRDFTVNASTALFGMDLTWLKYSAVERVKLVGIPYPGFGFPANSVGILLDGSWTSSPAPACASNVIRHCWFDGWDTSIKMIGNPGMGQANFNLIQDCTIRDFNIGINLTVGSTNTFHHNLISSYQPNASLPKSAIGIRLGANASTNLIDKMYVDGNSNLIGVQVANGADNNVICNSYFGSGTGATCVQIDAGATQTQLYGNRYLSSSAYAVLDNTANELNAYNTTRAGPLIPFTFYMATPIASSLVSQAITIPGAGTSFQVGRPYMVRGITCRTTSNCSAGTLIVKPTIGGADSPTLQCALTSGMNADNNWQGMFKDTDNGNLRLGASVTTSGTWAPTANTLQVTVWIEFEE